MTEIYDGAAGPGATPDPSPAAPRSRRGPDRPRRRHKYDGIPARAAQALGREPPAVHCDQGTFHQPQPSQEGCTVPAGFASG